MFGWLRRLVGPGPPSRRELMALQNVCDALEERVDQHYAELKKLRGRVYATARFEKASEDAPGSTNGEPEASQPTPARHTPSAHLARRFRSF